MSETPNRSDPIRIAIVGIACEYPDARSPEQLWENVLAQRRSFRRIPPERLNADDYFSSNPTSPDKTYAFEAALIEGYEFDRVRFRIAGTTFRAADMTHWLALDVASRALADAGFEEGKGLPRKTTGVLLGNTLTGEFSRASLMRLRWPYVRRVVGAMLKERDWTAEQQREFLGELESSYKAPFPPVGEDTLAGGLSNTIAGRICNYFDLKGGGYTVDGACSSSLLAVSTACSGLSFGDLDVALAGGVDLSLDPFEIIGFAKTSALAAGEMRVYDARSSGFWPGEGCGLVVLMRYEDAVAQGRRIYATIRGWGISSDGSGGITRPEVEGQLFALRRAYRMARYDIGTVAFIEGHGTGTAVGDETELRVLLAARREAGNGTVPTVVGSVKANIGHTKAAAGAAGLIKAILALEQQVIPPTTGSQIPHPVLREGPGLLRTACTVEPWPSDLPLRASVSSMGFGGINVHIALEGVVPKRRAGLKPREVLLAATAQDAELFLLSGPNAASLRTHVEELLDLAPRISRGELADLAATLEADLAVGSVRAAIVASTPSALTTALESLRSALADGVTKRFDLSAGLFLGSGDTTPTIGFLFPGQGSPSCRDGGAAQHRFRSVREVYERAGLPWQGDGVWTAIAQPAIVTASTAGLRILDRLGVTASVAFGHSLGELTALHWAGAFDETALLRIATARGKAMADAEGPVGGMASIGASPDEVELLLEGEPVVVSGHNTGRQTTISGEADAVERIVARAKGKGLQAVRLKVSHAFHSPLMAPVVSVLKEFLSGEQFKPPASTMISTITGSVIDVEEDIRGLLCRQLLEPVLFAEAVASAEETDLFIEVGPGRVLSGLAALNTECPVVPTEIGGVSLTGLLQAVGAAYAMGAPIDHRALFEDRVAQPFALDWKPRFFVNPCERAPAPDGSLLLAGTGETSQESMPGDSSRRPPADDRETLGAASSPDEIVALVRDLVAARVELPTSAVKDDHRLLDDLHMNSIVVGQVVTEVAGRLGLSPVTAPTEFANATVAEVARALEELARTDDGGAGRELDRLPPGVDTWLRYFTVEMIEHPIAVAREAQGDGNWQILASPDDPVVPALTEKLTEWGGDGVIVCLPPDTGIDAIHLLLTGAQEVLRRKEPTHFVLLQRGGGGAALARCLHQEGRDLTTTVVDLPPDDPHAVERVCAEVAAAVGYTEAHYDADGCRREPSLRLLSGNEKVAAIPLGPNDVLFVTGGGKGIASECAFDLAKETGTRLVLLGRSEPETDDRLAANLRRMEEAGIRFEYLSADVRDRDGLAASVRAAEGRLGPVTALLHAAGSNEPQLIQALDEKAIQRTVAPKVEGAANVLAAVDAKRLRLFVTFGSILARTGMRGEADYALANEWLTQLTERFQLENPHCRCLAIEWSLWSGAGMGERLGRVEALVREGVTPITVDQGVRILRDLMTRRLPHVSVVVAGRFGEVPTLRLDRGELPLLRFLERPRVHYPGVELIGEADLSRDTDPYLDDHVFEGTRILPAVIGLEAMAQVAMALVGSETPPRFEKVEFKRPVAVSTDKAHTIRVAALARSTSVVEIVLRSAETSFQVDHFIATCHFGNRREQKAGILREDKGNKGAIGINPDEELYGGLLFQGGRFRRLRGYRRLKATECEAELGPADTTGWFGQYLPPRLVLGDPGTRDAAIHAIQACIPHARILPVGVERVLPGRLPEGERITVRAKERRRDGDLFVYDLDLLDASGRILERWEGLRLQVVGTRGLTGPWSLPLLAPYVERRITELLPGSTVGIAVERGSSHKEREGGDAVIRRAIGKDLPVTHRPDGKPEVGNGLHVSAAQSQDIILAVSGTCPVGCDLEAVTTRSPSVWNDLLGKERFDLAAHVAKEEGESFAEAATRVWAAMECLKKVGAPVKAPIVLAAAGSDGWVILRSGRTVTVTYSTSIQERAERLTLAVLCDGADGRSPVSSPKGNDASV